MSFASLLQKAEMVPLFLLMYATAAVLSSFNNTCNVVLFLQKASKQKKAACNSREFMWHLFAIQFHPPPISVTWSVHLQHQKCFLSTTVIHLLLPLRYKLSSQSCHQIKSGTVLCIFPIPCYAFGHMEQLWMRTLWLLWFVIDIWLLLDNLKRYSGKACKWIVSFPQSDLLSFLQSLSQTLGILSVV